MRQARIPWIATNVVSSGMRRGILGGWPVRAELVEQATLADETAVTIEQGRPAGRPPGPPAEPPPDRELWPWLLALLLVVLGVIAAVYFATRDDRSGNSRRPATTAVEATTPWSPVTTTAAKASRRVTIPRLLGLRAPDALRRLRSAGLTGTTRNVFSQKPRNVVVAQTPGASRTLARGELVTLEVSKGPKALPVPDVVGQSVADALSTLQTQGFGARVVRVPNAAPAGQVVAQHPKAGATAQPRAVRLNVSAGKHAAPAPSPAAQTAPKPDAAARTTAPRTAAAPRSDDELVRVPVLEGRKLSEARRLVRNVGLVIEIRRVPNAQPPGTVVAQAQKPDTGLRRGSHLLVTVSLGRHETTSSGSSSPDGADGASAAPVSIPDVVGEDETSAEQDLRNAGLMVRAIDRDTADPTQDGLVVGQSPAASESAKQGSTVTIYVGRYTESN